MAETTTRSSDSRSISTRIIDMTEKPSKPVTAGLSALTILVVWQALSFFYPPSYLPGPRIVAQEIVRILASGEFLTHMLDTFRRVIVGFLIAIFLAVPAGIAMGSNQFAEDFLEVETMVGITIPGLMWGMLAIMFFGIQEIGAYFAVAIIVAPMLTINLWEGMKSVDKNLVEMAVVFKTNTSRRIKDVIIPQLLPYIFASTRFGLGLAWKVVVVIELLGFSSGVGYKVTQSYQKFNTSGVLAWTITFTLVMLIIEYGVLNHLEERLLGWRPEVEVWRR